MIITKNTETKKLQDLVKTYLGYEIFYFDNLKDLLPFLQNLKKEKIIFLGVNHSFNYDFYEKSKYLNSLDGNILITTNNFEKPDCKSDVLKFSEISFTNNMIPHLYSAILKKKDIISLIENTEYKSYDEFLKKFNYDFVTNKNMTSPVQKFGNIYHSYEKIFMDSFKNQLYFDSVIQEKYSYQKFKKSGKFDYPNQLIINKIYNELHNTKLSYIFISHSNILEFEKILEKFKDSFLNHKHNTLYLVNSHNLCTKNINCKIIKISNFKNEFKNIKNRFYHNFEIYFFDSIDKINIVKPTDKDKNFIYYNEENKTYECLKIKTIYANFFEFENYDFCKYISFLGNLVYAYFDYEVCYFNKPLFFEVETTKPKIQINYNLIEQLYEKNLYDECIFLINLVIKNRLSYNNSYIYKTLVLSQKINFYISKEQIIDLLNLIDFESFLDLFQISIVLIYKNLLPICKKNLFEYLCNKTIDKKEVNMFLVLIKKLNFLTTEINLFKDKFIINSLVNNLDDIISYINKEKVYLDDLGIEEDIKDVSLEILLYLNNRFEIIEDEKIKQKITKTIENVIFDINNLDKISDDKILESFFQYKDLIFLNCNSLSDIMVSTEDINIKRSNLMRINSVILKCFDSNRGKMFDLLSQKKILINDSLFKFSYHGIPNRELFTSCINLSLKNIKINHEYAKKKINIPDFDTNEKLNLFYFQNKKTNPKKICFLSDYLTKYHSVFKDRHQVIVNLIKKGFEVYIAVFSNLDFKYQGLYQGVKEIINLANYDNFERVMKMRSYQFDKLVFCEIGMCYKVKEMAYFRMANKQYNTWGHSDTSGFPEIDYFVSSELYELPYEESKEHYSEKLILQKGMSTCYVNPTKNYQLNITRSYFGLSEFENIICCPQSLFKIHPEFDYYIFEILKRNVNSSLVLLDTLSKRDKMYERWNKVLKDMPQYYGVLSRVKFIPFLDHEKFCNLMKVSDVMIDPYPFGGCNSSLESFSLGKPLVTQPSIRINGRFTYGFYKRMGFMDLVANNMEEYVSLTTRLLQDKDFHQQMTDKILENKDKLFMDQQTLDEWEELMAEE